MAPCFAMTPWGMAPWPAQPPFMPTHPPHNNSGVTVGAATLGFNPSAYQTWNQSTAAAAGAPVAPGWGFPFPHWGYPQSPFQMPQHGNAPPPSGPHGHANHHAQQQQQQQLPHQQQAMNAALAAAVAQQQHAAHGFMQPPGGASGTTGFDQGIPSTVPTPNSVNSQSIVQPGNANDGSSVVGGGNGQMPPGLGFSHQGSAVNSAVFLSMRNNTNGAANGQVMPPQQQGANGFGNNAGGNGGHPGFNGNNVGGGPNQLGGPQQQQSNGGQQQPQQQQQHPDPAQLASSYQAHAAAAVAAANANSIPFGSRAALPGQNSGYHPYRRM